MESILDVTNEFDGEGTKTFISFSDDDVVHIFHLGHELVLKWKEVACCFFLFEFGTYSREEVSKSFVHLDRNCIAGWTPFRFHIQLRGSIVQWVACEVYFQVDVLFESVKSSLVQRWSFCWSWDELV